jgi:hypothetical protein
MGTEFIDAEDALISEGLWCPKDDSPETTIQPVHGSMKPPSMPATGI